MDCVKTTLFLMEDMLRFLKQAPVVIPAEGTIAGFSLFDPEKITPPDLPRDMHLYDNLHFSMGTVFLKEGFSGVARRARQAMKPDISAERLANLEAISKVYDGISAFIARHIDAVDEEMKRAEGKRKKQLAAMRETL